MRTQRSIQTGMSARVRRGATLTEVLMALLFMSVGVVSVMSLFPISVKRAVHGTNLTNSAIHRMNAEVQVDLLGTGIDIDNPSNPAAFRSQNNYVVDPLGALIVGTNTIGASPAAAGFTIPRVMPPSIAALPAAQQLSAADAFATLPDSWVFQGIGIPTGGSPTSADMPADVDLSSVPYATGAGGFQGDSRVIIFDAEKRASHTRRIDTIAAQTISWTDPLPAGFVAGEVQVETKERRYTYLLSVRKSGFSASVDCIVFFRRGFSPSDEYAYTVHWSDWGPDGVDGTPGTNDDGTGLDGKPGVAFFDDDFNGTVDDNSELNAPESDDVRTVTVDWSGIPATQDAPRLEKGKFLFDVGAARWYRIQDVHNETATKADVLVETDITGHGVDTTSGGIFMSGVVDVYPLGVKDW